MKSELIIYLDEKKRFVPVNHIAKIFCAFAQKRFLELLDIDLIKELGFEVKIQER